MSQPPKSEQRSNKDLYVCHLPASATEDDVRRLFAVCGKVTYVHMVKDAKSNDFVGCAFVKMSSDAEAKDAIVTLDGARLINREISVTAARPQAAKGGPNKSRPARGEGSMPGREPREAGRGQQSRTTSGPGRGSQTRTPADPGRSQGSPARPANGKRTTGGRGK